MAKPPTRGRSRRFNILIFSLLALFLVGALGLVLAISGVNVPLLGPIFAKEKANTHAGRVAVLVSPVPLTAFTALDPAAFIDPKTGDFYVQYVGEKSAETGGLIRDPNLLNGRVLKKDKLAGRAFTEADFYPRGTNASPTAAVVPGNRLKHLSAQDAVGLRGLKRFDRVDLIAVIADQSGSAADPTWVDPDIKKVNDKNKLWETTRRTVAQNALIVVPIPEKNPRGGAATEEAALSVTDDEFAAITEAMARGAKIECAARSGLPGGDLTDMPDQEAPTGATKIRVTEGTTSSDTLVPATKKETPNVIETNGSVPTPK